VRAQRSIIHVGASAHINVWTAAGIRGPGGSRGAPAAGANAIVGGLAVVLAIRYTLLVRLRMRRTKGLDEMQPMRTLETGLVLQGGGVVVLEDVSDRVLDAVRGVADGVPDARRDRVGEQHRGDPDGGEHQR
jgi:hypothetical protein